MKNRSADSFNRSKALLSSTLSLSLLQRKSSLLLFLPFTNFLGSLLGSFSKISFFSSTSIERKEKSEEWVSEKDREDEEIEKGKQMTLKRDDDRSRESRKTEDISTRKELLLPLLQLLSLLMTDWRHEWKLKVQGREGSTVEWPIQWSLKNRIRKDWIPLKETSLLSKSTEIKTSNATNF